MKKYLLSAAFMLSLLKTDLLLSQEEVPTSLNGIAAKILFLDYNTPNSVDGFKVSNGLEIAYLRNFDDRIALGVPLKIALANLPEQQKEKTTLVSLDLTGQFRFAKPENKFIPYLFAGLGMVFEGVEENNLQVPAGLGMYYRVGRSSFLTLQAEYRKSFEKDRDNIQLGLGWYFKLITTPRPPGPVDADGDGIPDAQDHCPDEAGTLTANGCPDTDDDGIPNGEDDCPTIKGTPENKGCPPADDRDGDGIVDSKDKCPDQPGTPELNGCPPKTPEKIIVNADSDGDGVVDDKDECPETPGPIVLLGCPDSDGDGIADKNDKCPDEPGLATRNGCPPKDSDKDGILDEDDRCPTLPGKATLQGCPDEDGDGITDDVDECPNRAGVPSAKGCPDRDGDGIRDSQDKCPDEKGMALHEGCPVFDADNDGIPDKDDRCPNEKGSPDTKGCPDKDSDGVPDLDDLCPNEAGLASAKGCPDEDDDGTPNHLDKCPGEKGPNQGCPDLKKEDKEFLAFAAKNVQFETGKATLKAQSYTTLEKVADIMTRYPKYMLFIGGHTDDIGDASANQQLSEERAKSCYEYLLSRGVSSSRMQYQGFGESQPLQSNKTPEGREANRRVEFNVFLK